MSDYVYTEEDRRQETEAFMKCCGTCLNFVSYMATAGFCKIAECNCLCKNPKAMIDMFDEKCDKWVVNQEEMDKFN